MVELNRIRSLRYVVLVGLRVLAVLMLISGFYPLMTLLVLSNPWQNIGLLTFFDNGFNWLALTLGLWVPGILLVFSSHRIAKWIVPTFRHECLNCGYLLKSLKADHCPECGSTIPTADKTSSKIEE
ncbi:MAG: hypothetical protein IH984_07790 [Planctomycetes bacterium]|nr:hypothetical protein [Planctomycetota bacterium]